MKIYNKQVVEKLKSLQNKIQKYKTKSDYDLKS